ncbi:MAG: hypothetical protein KatS3mg111_2496 [Pirellulaceae bacterium]|nr:MAG: hypothetical protein KatS3mg111_2496 [Pirellulaceae bacterium]
MDTIVNRVNAARSIAGSCHRQARGIVLGAVFGWLAIGALGGPVYGDEGPEATGSRPDALLSVYCYDCHTGDGAEGGVQLDFLQRTDVDLSNHVEVMEKAIRVLRERQMPPADMDQPDDRERVALLTWIEQRLHSFDCGAVQSPGRVTLRRLNRAEYNNTVRDLTGLDLQLANDFPSDDVGHGFDNIGDVLTIPPILMEKYVDAAMKIAEKVVADDRARRQVFPYQPEGVKDTTRLIEFARNNIRHFGLRAFRRPLTEAEEQRFFEFARSRFEAGDLPAVVQQAIIAAMLTSPDFLFHMELAPDEAYTDGIRRLNDFELANRLSYFLWSSMPDDELFELAGAGKLGTPQALTEQALRMLRDEKSQALVENFAGQWLQLRQLDRITPDPELFPDFDKSLRDAARKETELLFRHIMVNDRSVLELLNADYTFVNQRLANHYGIRGVEENGFVRVQLPNRRGVLMHTSILLITSNPTRTSPVKRGKWVLDNLLGEPPPPPPPDVPELSESAETLGTLRQQMEQHRANPNCAVCHDKMDALGFGLENFDVIGKWRDTDGRYPIDASGELPGGRRFEGPIELIAILADEKKTEFVRCLTQRMLTYALGRGLTVGDRCTVSQIVDHVAQHDYRFSALIEGIVSSPQFMMQAKGD